MSGGGGEMGEAEIERNLGKKKVVENRVRAEARKSWEVRGRGGGTSREVWRLMRKYIKEKTGLIYLETESQMIFFLDLWGRWLSTPAQPGTPVMRVLHLTDLHLDDQYLAGADTGCGEPLCCRNTDTYPGNHQPSHNTFPLGPSSFVCAGVHH